MKKISKNKVARSLFLVLGALLAFLPGVMAHCPLCTGATIIGVGISRSMGLDDSIVGVFVGAMIISSALWMNNLLIKRGMKGNALLRVGSLTFITALLTLVTFYYAGLFGVANDFRIFGIERLTFGAISGSIVSLGAFWLSSHIKMKNEGKVLFNYQTMILTFSGLMLNAVAFWLMFR